VLSAALPRTRRRPRPVTVKGLIRYAVSLLVAFLLPFLGVTALVRAGVIDIGRDYHQTTTSSASDVRLDRLMRARACSTHGLGQGVVPAHAIVRDPGTDSVRLTSFDEGWAVYQGKRPGTLVAVCRR
jgi:hypothetical protein